MLCSLVKAGGGLYGTTFEGGIHGLGTVYAIAPSGTETILHSFAGPGDAAYPTGKLLNVNGVLYGTAGGDPSDPGCDTITGCGTIFEIEPGGTEKLLYAFRGKADGQTPNGDLTVLNGVIYGTTELGAKGTAGTVFSITPEGTFKTIYTFLLTNEDGRTPLAGLLADGKLLYGTTSGGATVGQGTVFSIKP
jgi:uncharacterized repeat protein (TIGR03803 family)